MMLVLTRAVDEAVLITIGDETIRVVVTRIGNKVRLGFVAGPDVKILREELVAATLRQQAPDATQGDNGQ